jgi:stearoyl-CoA desaturase (delta-9 desaturase)
MIFNNLMLVAGVSSAMFNISIGYAVLITAILCFAETISETVYLHRYLTHKALTLNIVVCYVFEFILFFTTGIPPLRWAKIHIKHHQTSDTPDDPHSPKTPFKFFGIKITGPFVPFLKYFYLYHPKVERYLFIRDSVNESLKKESSFSRIVFHKFSFVGPILFLLILSILFGWTGFWMWLIIFLYLPVVAGAGVNGLGHGSHDKHTETHGDYSANIFGFMDRLPWYIYYPFFPLWFAIKTVLNLATGGEYRHYIHHLKSSSARLALKWHQFDVGYFFIWFFYVCRLADNIKYVSFDTGKLVVKRRKDNLSPT